MSQLCRGQIKLKQLESRVGARRGAQPTLEVAQPGHVPRERRHFWPVRRVAQRTEYAERLFRRHKVALGHKDLAQLPQARAENRVVGPVDRGQRHQQLHERPPRARDLAALSERRREGQRVIVDPLEQRDGCRLRGRVGQQLARLADLGVEQRECLGVLFQTHVGPDSQCPSAGERSPRRAQNIQPSLVAPGQNGKPGQVKGRGRGFGRGRPIHFDLEVVRFGVHGKDTLFRARERLGRPWAQGVSHVAGIDQDPLDQDGHVVEDHGPRAQPGRAHRVEHLEPTVAERDGLVRLTRPRTQQGVVVKDRDAGQRKRDRRRAGSSVRPHAQRFGVGLTRLGFQAKTGQHVGQVVEDLDHHPGAGHASGL